MRRLRKSGKASNQLHSMTGRQFPHKPKRRAHDRIRTKHIVGGGTSGDAGIAFVAARAGFKTLIVTDR